MISLTKEEKLQLADNIPSLWVLQNDIKTSDGKPFEFEKHQFMVDFLDDMNPLQVLLKPPQIGASETEIVKTFFIAKKLKKDIIYTLPTQSDVYDMVGSKVNRIVAQNPILKDWVKDHDTVEQKAVGDNIIHYRGCVDTDTEILTEKGWCKFGSIEKGDRLPTLNILTNTVEMDVVLDMSCFDIDGDMVRIKSRQIDQLLTPDHRCVISKRTFKGEKSPLRIAMAYELVKKTTAYIPMTHTGISMPHGNAGDTAFYRILGWVIGDGCYWTKRDKSVFKRKDGTINPKIYESKKVCIIQSKFCLPLEDDLLCAGIGYHKKKHGKNCFRYELNAKASVAIREVIPNKHLTHSLVFGATPFELKALYDGLMMSDGNNYLNTHFYQNSGETVDSFQAMMVLLGKTTSVQNTRKNVTVSIKTTDYAEVKADYEKYKGIAWCPTTHNGTIFIRRNGIVSVTGQTFTAKAAMMVSSSLNVHDEVDASDLSVITQYENRLQAQEDGGMRWYFSHPSLAGAGVDVYWQKSDKKEWVITCPHCAQRQVLSWPKSVSREKEAYVCKSCDGILSDEARIHGKWVATAKGEFSGYHVSQLMIWHKSAKDILNSFDDPLKDKQYFHNYVLGLPYTGGDDQITTQQVLANCTDDTNSTEGRIIIGVDTGLPIHYVLMNKEGIFYYGKCKPSEGASDPYDDLRKLLGMYPKSVIVSDQGGDLIGIRKLQQEYPGRVFLAYYRKDKKSPETIKWGEGDDYGIVTIDRNAHLQLMIEQLKDKGRIRLNGQPAEWQEFADHFANMYREKIVTKETKDKDDRSLYGAEYVWKRRGPDHFAHCTGYALAGMSKYGQGLATIQGDNVLDHLMKGQMMNDAGVMLQFGDGSIAF